MVVHTSALASFGRLHRAQCLLIATLAGAGGCTLLFNEQTGAGDDAGVTDDAGATDDGGLATWSPSVDWVSNTDSLSPDHLVQETVGGSNRDILIGSFSGTLMIDDQPTGTAGDSGNIGFITINLSDGSLSMSLHIGVETGTLSVVSVSKSPVGYSMTGSYQGFEYVCPNNAGTSTCFHNAVAPLSNAFSTRYPAIPDGIVAPETATAFGAEPNVNNAIAATSKTSANDSLALSENNLVIGSFFRDIEVLPLGENNASGAFINPVATPTVNDEQLYIALIGVNNELLGQLSPISRADLGSSVGWTIDEIPSSSDVYATGTFTKILDLGIGPPLNAINDTNTLFVSKFSADLGTNLWISSFGSRVSSTPIFSHVSSDGSLLVTGAYTGEFLLDGDEKLVAGGDNENVFLLKVDTGGSIVWASNIGGTGNLHPRGLVVDSTGAIYVAGTVRGDLGVPGTTAKGEADGFVVKLNSEGQTQGAFRFGGAGDEKVVALNLSEDDELLVSFLAIAPGDPSDATFELNGNNIGPGRYIFKFKQ